MHRRRGAGVRAIGVGWPGTAHLAPHPHQHHPHHHHHHQHHHPLLTQLIFSLVRMAHLQHFDDGVNVRHLFGLEDVGGVHEAREGVEAAAVCVGVRT